jgi:dipeptidyl aminopeptidase/acylaminoacyl peptidase
MPSSLRPLLLAAGAVLTAVALPLQTSAAQGFTVEQVSSYPFPTGLTASTTGSRIAWTLNERGIRNVFVAEGPEFVARQLTPYAEDDGQELTSVQLSGDGRWVVYVRGGEHGSNWDRTLPVNPRSLPGSTRVQVWSVPFAGGEPRALGEGSAAVVSPRGDAVVFVRDRQLWRSPIDGSSPAVRITSIAGDNGSPEWSPDGSRIAFVSARGTHSFIGIHTDEHTPIRWLAPSTSRDGSPRWSTDGSRLAFVRRDGGGGAPDSILAPRHQPWAIWVADASTGTAQRIWKAPATLRGSAPTTHGGTNLRWGAGDRIAFVSYEDGWPHLYSIPAGGGSALQLTRGNFMVEHVSLSPDGRRLLFSANTGPRPDDIDRRHVATVPMDRAEMQVLTPGTDLEWAPVLTGDGRTVAFISATPQRPPVPAVMPLGGGAPRLIGAERIPRDFPAAALVTPRQVIYRAGDGVTVHAQLFEPPGGGASRAPAIVYVHGGPPRQMLLGWHYGDYYANAYALNQYLASRGFVVLSVNFRLGIGYGYEFHRPPRGGMQGADEYLDVRAGAEYLRALPGVDPGRIGIYGGSYGGFLTALALARDSELFAAGVDVHGVHDWTTERARGILNPDRYEQAPDVDSALAIAWRSSPVASIDRWRSPVLLIHADDDRNVRFSQTADLARRLSAAGVPFEEIVIPDDTHHFMLWENQVLVNRATAEFFERVLRDRGSVAGRSR